MEFDPRHHELNNISAAERGQIYKKFTKQEELDPQDMTRYMARYRYIEEINYDSSFSPITSLYFLKYVTKCERNDCEMLMLLLMKELACRKLS